MIEIRELCAGYGEKDVLQNINLTIERGQVTALVGPNGCGKSTLLKTLVGILKKRSGEIRIDDMDLCQMTPQQLARRVAYLPQNRQVPDITVFRMTLHGRFAHLGYPRRYRKTDLEAAQAALERVGMAEQAEEMMNRLSGGQQQKVYLAMALAQDADAILLDEPTTYLDIAYQLKTLEMARELAAAGKAVVLILHDLSQALGMADRVIVLEDGRVVQTGTPEEVFDSGCLDNVFDIRVKRVSIDEGRQYVCLAKQEG